MPTSLKRLGLVFAVVVVLLLLAIVYIQLSVEFRLRKSYDVDIESITIPEDEASIEHGKTLVVVGRCTECHGLDLGGQVTSDSPAVGEIYASNLTSGKGGVGRTYTDSDWLRSIRHGIGPDGRSLVITPAQFYYYLSDEELGAIIAYIKSVPPVDNELPDPSVGILGRVFVSLFRDGAKEWLPAEKIDHSGPRPEAPEPAVSEEYGQYLVTTRTCLVCHNPKEISLAEGGDLAGWPESQFNFAMRSSGDRSMSISVRRMTNDELAAIWLYLQTLPPYEGKNATVTP